MSFSKKTLNVIHQTIKNDYDITDKKYSKEKGKQNRLQKGFLLSELSLIKTRSLNLTKSNACINLPSGNKFNSLILDSTSGIKDPHKLKYNRSNKYTALNYKISVKVTEDILSPSELKSNSKSPTMSDKIKIIEKELAIRLRPVHPQVNDPLLSTYFVIDIQDRSKAEQVISHLRRYDFVDSVYIKPDDELPSSNI